MDDKEFLRRMRAGDGPAWRWHRADQLLEAKAEPDALDDALTRAAWRLRQMTTAGHGFVVTTASPLLDPALSAAYQIYSGDAPARWEIEARILAGESTAIISQKCNVPVDVIVAFCDLFFDVRDQLTANSWLMTHVVDMCIGSGRPPSESQVWRYAALAGGPFLVDVLTADFHKRTDPQLADRHQLAEQARFMAIEAVTGYSPKATKNLIRAGRSLFGGPAKRKGNRPGRGFSRELATLKRLADLHSKGESARQREQRKQRVAEYNRVQVAMKRFMAEPCRPRRKAKVRSSPPVTLPSAPDQVQMPITASTAADERPPGENVN